MGQNDNLIGGLILISLGTIFLLNNFVGYEVLWPLFILFPAIIIIINYVLKPKSFNGNPIVGVTTLLTISVFFLLFTTSVLTWDKMATLWPVFILGPGAGLILNHFFGEGKTITGGLILTTISLVFLMGGHFNWVGIWPAILITLGLIIIISSYFKKK